MLDTRVSVFKLDDLSRVLLELVLFTFFLVVLTGLFTFMEFCTDEVAVSDFELMAPVREQNRSLKSEAFCLDTVELTLPLEATLFLIV